MILITEQYVNAIWQDHHHNLVSDNNNKDESSERKSGFPDFVKIIHPEADLLRRSLQGTKAA
jgi:hypothetical protein